MSQIVHYVMENFIDDRGKLTTSNAPDFFPDKIRRFYHVRNHNPNVIRAWHGHEHESKWVYVVRGTILFAAFPMEPTTEKETAWDNYVIGGHRFRPASNCKVIRLVLSENDPRFVYVPAGWANGWKQLTAEADVMYFSDKHFEDCKYDDYRFSPELFKSTWTVENR